MNAKDVLGRAGEQAAVSYLEGCGFRILDRNWRSADGEILSSRSSGTRWSSSR